MPFLTGEEKLQLHERLRLLRIVGQCVELFMDGKSVLMVERLR